MTAYKIYYQIPDLVKDALTEKGEDTIGDIVFNSVKGIAKNGLRKYHMGQIPIPPQNMAALEAATPKSHKKVVAQIKADNDTIKFRPEQIDKVRVVHDPKYWKTTKGLSFLSFGEVTHDALETSYKLDKWIESHVGGKPKYSFEKWLDSKIMAMVEQEYDKILDGKLELDRKTETDPKK